MLLLTGIDHIILRIYAGNKMPNGFHALNSESDKGK